MLYYLFNWLDKVTNIPGLGVFKYISFRTAMAGLLSLFLSMIIGKYIINILRKNQIGEDIRDLGLQGQLEKKGTPTMGGIIILFSILIPILLFNKLDNIYIILMIITTVWLGLLGFIDDYIKVVKKRNLGLTAIQKLVLQFAATAAFLAVLAISGKDTTTTIPFDQFVAGFVVLPALYDGLLFHQKIQRFLQL